MRLCGLMILGFVLGFVFWDGGGDAGFGCGESGGDQVVIVHLIYLLFCFISLDAYRGMSEVWECFDVEVVLRYLD